MTPPAAADWRRRVRTAARRTALGHVAAQAVGLAALAALYRLTSPAAFGLMGMALPLVMLLRMAATLGWGAAAVQREDLDRRQLSTLLWLNLATGALAAAVSAACGPLLAWAFGAPELSWLAAALGAGTLAAAAGVLPLALLERELRQGRLALLRLASQVLGAAAAIAAAWAGWQAGALALGQGVELAALAAGAWASAPFRPLPPWRSAPAAGALRFGGAYGASTLLQFAAQHADKAWLAWLYGASPAGQAALGLYTQAFNLMLKPVYFTTAPLHGVALAGLARLRRGDAESARLLSDFFRLTVLVLAPCGLGLALTADEVMLLLGGPAWADAGPLLAALAPVMAVQGLLNLSFAVFAAAGRVDRLVLATGGAALALGAAYAVGAWLADPSGAAPLAAARGVGLAFSLTLAGVVAGPWLVACGWTAGVRPVAWLAPLARPAAAAVGMAALVWGLSRVLPAWGPAARLACLAGAGAAAYGLLAWGELRWLLGWLARRDEPAAPPTSR